MYSAGLFLGTPFTIGYISAYVFNARGAQSERHTMQVALLAVALAGGAMLVFALEGAVCIAMAFPIAALLALPGAILGRAVALRSVGPPARAGLDRKSTRLNSSHLVISYAVFCLKKKKQSITTVDR